MTQMLSSIQIRIDYRTNDGNAGVLCIEPASFFDEPSDIQADSIRDLVWRFDHATDYLHMRPEQLAETTLDVHCAATKERIRDVETFWNGGVNRIVFRREMVEDREVYWLRIVEVATGDGIHFLRFSSESASESGLLEHHVVPPDDHVRYLFP